MAIRKRGKYPNEYYTVYWRDPVTGKRKERTAGYLLRDARALDAEIKNDIRKGRYISNDNRPIGELLDEWLATKKNKAPGTYENESTNTDANGTTVTNKNVSDVTVDANGNKREVTTKKTTKDPKGLFNKTTSTSTTKKTEGNY